MKVLRKTLFVYPKHLKEKVDNGKYVTIVGKGEVITGTFPIAISVICYFLPK